MLRAVETKKWKDRQRLFFRIKAYMGAWSGANDPNWNAPESLCAFLAEKLLEEEQEDG